MELKKNFEVPDFQYHFNEIKVKLHKKLNIKEHKDIPDIEKISDKKMDKMTAGEKVSLQFYINKHVFFLETQKLINSKFTA